MRCMSLGFTPVLLLAWLTASTAASEPAATVEAAYARAYDLRFAEALGMLDVAQRVDPSNPAPARAVAAITWIEMLLLQGVVTFDAFTGEASQEAVSRPPVPPAFSSRFLTHVQRAMAAAAQQVTARPHDADAQYELAATQGLLALYRSTVEGRTLAGFREGRRAVAAMERIRASNPGRREAALIPGMYKYAVSTLPLHMRLVAALGGMSGDRDGGISLLETAASPGALTASDASLVLMIVYNRERRHGDALRHLQRLQRAHPGNRLIRLNTAATALAAGQPMPAERELADWPDESSLRSPVVLGERALWLYVRGASRAALGHQDARPDLQGCLASDPREWVRARAHLELAKLALASGNEPEAKAQFDAAAHYGRRSGDKKSIQGAKHRAADGRSRHRSESSRENPVMARPMLRSASDTVRGYAAARRPGARERESTVLQHKSHEDSRRT